MLVKVQIHCKMSWLCWTQQKGFVPELGLGFLAGTSAWTYSQIFFYRWFIVTHWPLAIPCVYVMMLLYYYILKESCRGKRFLIWVGFQTDHKCKPYTWKAEGNSCPEVAQCILCCSVTVSSHTAITIVISNITTSIIVTAMTTSTVGVWMRRVSLGT